MDQKFNIPSFALLRYGTVILRLKMDRIISSSAPVCLHPSEGFLRVVRVASCEQCSRTRIVRKYSDCDSGSVGRCRRYKTRAAKSRYVNVCAAVCLLLLVGGLTPQSSAAPHRTRRMDKRAADQENETWANPCDYNKSYINSRLEYKAELAGQVAVQARDTLVRALTYKNEIAKLHSYEAFEDMLGTWSGTKWLQNQSRFKIPDGDIIDVQEYMLPSDKEWGKPIETNKLIALMPNINAVLPAFSKALKMLAASIRAISGTLGSRNLQSKLNETSDNLRHVLCLCSDVIRARGLKMLQLFDSEIPKYDNLGDSETFTDAFLIYRDTINFLEYIAQVFEHMKNDDK